MRKLSLLLRSLVVLMLLAGLIQPWNGPSLAGPAWQSTGIVVDAIDGDKENTAYNCDIPGSYIPFGNKDSNQTRCWTFRYDIPAGGITSATLHVAIEPLGGLQDTDSMGLLITPESQGTERIVVLHGGFRGGETSIDLDLFDLNCNPAASVSSDDQQAVIDKIRSGGFHMYLQDDTAVFRATLILNGGPLTVACGQSNRGGTPGTGEGAVEGGTAGGGTSGGGQPGSGAGEGGQPGSGTGEGGQPGGGQPGGDWRNGGVTNNTGGTSYYPPPIGSGEPIATERMTIQVGSRRVLEGQSFEIPVYLINASNIANMNFTVQYDPVDIQPQGQLVSAYLLSNHMFTSNTAEFNLIQAGFAGTSGVYGTGPIAYIPFVAKGAAGSRTELYVSVWPINDPAGAPLAIDIIPGYVEIVGANGLTQGDCNGDGRLNEVDALCALQISVNLIPPTLPLDMDNSGQIDSRDAVIILQRARRGQ